MKEIQEIQEIHGMQISGLEVKLAVKRSGLTKEQVVAAVQVAIKGKKDSNGDEITFSLAGLNRIYCNDFPKNNFEVIVHELANACRCSVSSFAEPETKTA